MTVLYQNVVGGAAPATLTAFITELNPAHWWKHDEASGDLLDTGSSGILDMSIVNGTVLREQDGPTAETSSYHWADDGDGGGSNAYARVATEPAPNNSVGCVVGFIQKQAFQDLTNNDWIYIASSASNYDSAIFAGWGAAGLDSGTLSLVYTNGSFSNRRVFTANPNPSLTNGAWHVFVINKESSTSAPVIYLNNNVVSMDQATNGTAPAEDAWFDDYTFDRTVIANGLWGTASQNFNQGLSNVFIMDRALTSEELTTMQSFISEPV